jgi:transcription antitermination protein NusB
MSKPGKRREGREVAVQILFHLDHNTTPLDEALPGVWSFRTDSDKPLASSDKARLFAEELVRGVQSHRTDIDSRIQRAASNFEIQRIGGVERAILRVATYEMLHCLEVPPVVSITEAIEIAKKFGAEEASRFVNGVLDRIRSEIKRPARTAAPAAGSTVEAEPGSEPADH